MDLRDDRQISFSELRVNGKADERSVTPSGGQFQPSSALE
jgi:hypothetical protein